jgi:cytochrome c556
MGRSALMISVLLIGSASGTKLDALADDKYSDKDVIAYREHIMSTLEEQAAAVGQILSGVIPPDNSTAHFDAIALTAKIALSAFEPKVPGGQAKANVWSDWPDFSKRMNDFAQKTAQTAKIAREQGNDAALAGIVNAFTCKNCHDVYRDESKK